MNKDTLTKDINNNEDLLLVQKAKEGDRKAFDRLVLRHQERVFNVCFRITGDYDVASDCAQETFLKVFKKLDSFKEKARFTTWIHRIAVNTCKNHLSTSYFRREYSRGVVREDKENEPASDREISDTRYDPEKEAINSDLKLTIERALLALPVDMRILVVMKDIEERTYEEVAEILKMKDGTVKSKLSRARKQLRILLQDIENEM